MKRPEPFRYRNSTELLQKAEELGVSLPFQQSIAPLFSASDILGTRIPNRMAVQPMEGFDSSPAGAPGELTYRRYRRYAEGGNGLIWFEACSVSPLDLMDHGKLNPAKCCNACSCCTDLMRNNQVVGCVIRDRSIYKQAYGKIRK